MGHRFDSLQYNLHSLSQRPDAQTTVSPYFLAQFYHSQHEMAIRTHTETRSGGHITYNESRRNERKGIQSIGTRKNTPDKKITSENAPTYKKNENASGLFVNSEQAEHCSEIWSKKQNVKLLFAFVNVKRMYLKEQKEQCSE